MVQRRSFLRYLWQWTTLFVGNLLLACKPRRKSSSTSSHSISLGPLKRIPSGRTEHQLFRVVTFREEHTLSAVSMVCTHQTCILRPGENGRFICPCHGSTFDDRGLVLNGPAVSPLPWYRLSATEAGEIELHLDQEVGPDWRLNL